MTVASLASLGDESGMDGCGKPLPSLPSGLTGKDEKSPVLQGGAAVWPGMAGC